MVNLDQEQNKLLSISKEHMVLMLMESLDLQQLTKLLQLERVN